MVNRAASIVPASIARLSAKVQVGQESNLGSHACMYRHSLDHCTYLLQRRLFGNETDLSFATKLLRKESLLTLNHVVEKNEEGVFHGWYSANVLLTRLTGDEEPKRQQTGM